MKFRRITLGAVTALAAVALSACGSSDDAGSAGGMGGMSSSSTATATGASTEATGPHNQADITFATDMIPHHQQAVAMAKLATTRAGSEEVKALAAKIEAAQGPEITTMSDWLSTWGEPVPDDMSMGHDMSSMGNGMMSEDDMSQLKDASGAAFDIAFLKGMTMHHEGAVQMAKAELSGGQNTQAKALAQAIVTTQNAEIGQMRDLIADLGA